MDSLIKESSKGESGMSPASPKEIKMSPITNLALDLSGLTTSVAGTPIRRISWSNPIPGGDKIGLNLDDLSPSNTDSPLFQDLMSSHDRTKHKTMRRAPRMALPSSSDEENKENVTPKLKGGTKPIPIEPACSRDQLDSGYSSISFTNKISMGSFESPTSYVMRRNSVLVYDEENSMENIFQLEEGDEHESLTVSDSLSYLLNKPLQGLSKSPKPATLGSRRGKLPIRRCLSMEVAFDPEAVPYASKNGTYLSSASTVSSCDSDMDVNGNCNFKRPDPPGELSGMQSKRRKSSPNIDSLLKPRGATKLHRSYSETAATIMHAILKSDMQPELIGDASRPCALPLVKGRHNDLKSINPQTLAGLLNGHFDDIDSFVIVDCRYPYEFEGGHIVGAKNIYTKEAIMEEFLKDVSDAAKRNIIIFHCEFSSERAPTLCRFLRNKDRERNEGNYPQLHHPEMYILEGGYKAFYCSYQELCEPKAYMPMNHKDHGSDLRHFRAKSKSWGADCKGRSKLRSHSKTSVI